MKSNHFKMRWLCFLFALFTLNIQAQITVDIKNKPLKEAIKTIERSSNYSFFYNVELEGLDKLVTVKTDNASLEETMKQLLKGTNITFQRKVDNVVVLLSKQQQAAKRSRSVSGKVVDEKGEAIIGASIIVKGSSIGTSTDVDGNFTINNISDNALLVVSSIGYKKTEVPVTNENPIEIRLNEDSNLMDEVVVVGYGVQKKINLTGSVVSVDHDVLANRPIANVTTGLQGMLPGVSIVNTTSRPGDNNSSIRVRGIGTLNNSDPLILIDGVEGDMNTLNPDDIESVSVLKDAASSSIYGSRAANGVILITTRKADREVKPTVTYTGYFAMQKPTALPEMLDAVEYLTLLKEATSNVNKSWGYTQEDIDAVINGTDPNFRANTNWIKEITRDYAPQHGHNVNINGGNKNMGYYLSYGNLTTSGLMVGNGYHATRNNVRMKLNTELFDRLTIEGNVSYTDVDNWTPASSDSENSGLFYQALRSSPLTPVKFTDGQWGYGGSSANPIAQAYDGGFINYHKRETSLNFSAGLRIIDGLTAKVQYATRLVDVLRKQQQNIIQHFYPDTETPLAYTSNTSKFSQRDIAQRYQNVMAQVDYDKTIGKHSFHILAGFSQEWQLYQQMDASRQDLVSNDLHVLNAGTDLQTNSGYDNHWAIRSGFGRVNYNFNDRYLVEANLRYDLSSRFHKDHRGGYFPSASVAWRLTEESFMESTRSWLDNLKIRASYGTLGNQYTSSLYPYMALIQPSTSNMPIGGEITSSMQQSEASNNILSWESIKMTNIGLDVNLLNNRLSLTADYFIKNTDDILLKVKLPDVLGVSEPYQNAGKVQNKGWEIALAWQDKIGKDFTYGVNVTFSDVKNKVVSVGNTADDFSGDRIRAVGYPIDAFWGYKSDGLYTVDDFDYDIATNTYTPKATTPIIEEYRTKVQPGDIKYVDIDGDGKITPTEDRCYIGSAIPRYNYTIGLNAAWRGIDFSLFLQGVGKCDGYIGGMGRHAFTELANYPQKAHLDRWTWENQNPHASYPRFTYDETYNRDEFSSFWLEDASYLRVKNLQVGYTVPRKGIISKMHIENLRIYFSGENLWTFTDFFSSYDPEIPVSSGGYYPITASYSLGLSITFK